MKIIKFTVYAVFVLATLQLSYARTYGPLVNKKGQTTLNGFPLTSWLGGNFNLGTFFLFEKENKKYLNWEIEKLYKKKISNCDIFSDNILSEKFSVKCMQFNPDIAKKHIGLVEYYADMIKFNSGDIDINELYIYLLFKYGSKKAKANYLKKFHVDYTDISKLLKKHRVLSITPIKYNKNNSYYSSLINDLNNIHAYGHDKKYYWLCFTAEHQINNKWQIIEKALKLKTIKSTLLFDITDFCRKQSSIPDNISALLISAFKKSRSNSDFALCYFLINKNPRLNKFILSNYRFKSNDSKSQLHKISKSEEALAIEWFLKGKCRLDLSRNIPKILYDYGLLCKDFNRAFGIWYQAAYITYQNKIKNRSKQLMDLIKSGKYRNFLEGNTFDNPARVIYNITTDDYLTPGAIVLLEKKSNLKMKYAKYILDNSYNLPQIKNFQINSKFSSLILPRHCTPSYKNKFPIASAVCFEKLSSKCKKLLWQTYMSYIEKKLKIDKNHKLIKSILKIKSPAYRIKTLKKLIENDNYISKYMLEGAILMWLPEVLKIAEKETPYFSQQVIEKIALCGYMANKAAPSLRKILVKRKHFTIKIACIIALVEIGDKSSISLIEKYVKDKNALLARTSRQALLLLKPLAPKQ